jgi:hypothetical protein
MWIFTRYGFFSIACANKPGSGSIDVDVVMVRSRLKEHLLNLQERFKDASLAKLSIESSSHTDYRYRLVIRMRTSSRESGLFWTRMRKTPPLVTNAVLVHSNASHSTPCLIVLRGLRLRRGLFHLMLCGQH